MAFIPGTRIPVSGTQPTIPGTNIPIQSGPVVGIDSSGGIVTRTGSGTVSVGRGSSGSSVSQPVVVSYTSSLTGQSYSSQAELQAAETKVRQEQTIKQQKAYDASGGLIGIGQGQQSYFRTTRPVDNTIAGSIRGTGAEKVTQDLAVASLREKGIDVRKMTGINQSIAIEREMQDLTLRAATPSQRARLEDYATIQTAAIGVMAAPIIFGAGLLGAAASGISKGALAMASIPPLATGFTDAVFSSGDLSKEQQYELARTVNVRVQDRVGKEGINIPFLNPQQERELTAANIPFGDGSLGVGPIVYDLPGGRVTTYLKGVQEYEREIAKLGFDESKVRTLAQQEAFREFGVRSVSEVAGFAFFGEATGEVAGAATQKGLNVFGKMSGKTLTKGQATIYSAFSGAVGGLVGGATETAIIYPSFKRGRVEEYTPVEYATAIGIGGVTAGVAGGVIGALTTRKFAQKGVYGLLGAAEAGQEFAGDWTAKKLVGDVFESGLNIQGMGGVPLQQATRTFNIVNIFSQSGATKSSGPQPTFVDVPFTDISQGFSPAPSRSPSVSPSTSSVSSMVQDLSLVIQPTMPVSPSVSGGSRTGTLTVGPSNTIVPSIDSTIVSDLTIVPDITPSIVPTQDVTPTQDITQSFTNSFVFSSTMTPTFTPTITAPFLPLLPPFNLDGSGGGFGGKGRSRKKYYDELASARGLFGEFDSRTGFGSRQVIAPTRTKPLTTKQLKAVSKARAKPFEDFSSHTSFDVEKLIFGRR